MLKNVQILRGIAALLVVISHCTGFHPLLLEKTFGAGVRGVDLFFVISGFVMVYTTNERPVSPGTFLTHRIVRVVPLYWLATLAIFMVALCAPSLLAGTRADLESLIKSLFFIPFIKSNGVMQPVLFVGWSLNYEMAFYILFCLALFIRIPALRIGLIITGLLLLCILGALLSPRDAILAFYLTDFLAEFAFGMMVGVLCPRIMSRPLAGFDWALVALGFALLLATLPYRWLSGIGAMMILAASLSLEARGHSSSNRWLLLLGGASYALYLTHAFPLLAIEKVARHLNLQFTPWLPIIILASIALVVVISFAVHLWVEKPLNAALRTSLSRHRHSGGWQARLKFKV